MAYNFLLFLIMLIHSMRSHLVYAVVMFTCCLSLVLLDHFSFFPKDKKKEEQSNNTRLVLLGQWDHTQAI